MTLATGKILVIRGGAIGDFILTLPVLSALRAEFPQAQVEVLGYAHIAQLALAGGLAHAVRPIEARGLAGFFARNGILDENLKRYFAEFALILSYLYDPDGIFRENVSFCTAARFIAGPHRPDDSAGLPASETLLKPLEGLAIFQADPVPRLALFDAPIATNLRLNPARKAAQFAPAPRWLAVHPGSGSERKNWPESKWAEFLREAVDGLPCQILLVGGEAEAGRLERLGAHLAAERYRVADKLPLVELSRLLCQCDYFIGHDSGISHLAAALGLRGVILWSESSEAVWRPRSEHLEIVRDPAGIRHLSVARVVEALTMSMTRI